MKDNPIRNSFEQIQPEAGARERMYANILRKAGAQRENQAGSQEHAEAKGIPQKRRTIPAWQRWCGLAACLALIVAAGLFLPNLVSHPAETAPPVLGGSPIEDVAGPQDFAQTLSFSIDAPEGAEDVRYNIFDGKIARVRFSLDGHSYTYEAAPLEMDLYGTTDEAVGSVSLDAEFGAVLDRLSVDCWRASWSNDGVSYYLSNKDGASEEEITEVAQILIAASCQ